MLSSLNGQANNTSALLQHLEQLCLTCCVCDATINDTQVELVDSSGSSSLSAVQVDKASSYAAENTSFVGFEGEVRKVQGMVGWIRWLTLVKLRPRFGGQATWEYIVYLLQY